MDVRDCSTIGCVVRRRIRAWPVGEIGVDVRYQVGDLFDLHDDDGFDLVYSHTVLRHLPDYRAGLEHLKTLVRPGGTVALIDNVCDH